MFQRGGLRSSNDSHRNVEHSWKEKRIPRSFHINNGKTELRIIQGDITKTKVDVIVNAANEHMTGGSGVDGIIHHAAGSKLLDECYRHREVTPYVRLPTGHSRILFSYNLSNFTRYIINTAGPIYNAYAAKQCEQDLLQCYETSIALANLYDLKSIAFPAISCGIFGYPVDKGAEAAIRASDIYAGDLTEVVFVLFDDHIYDAWIDKARTMDLKPINDANNSQKENISNESKAEIRTDDPKEMSDENETESKKEKSDQKKASNPHDSDVGTTRNSKNPKATNKKHADDDEKNSPSGRTTFESDKPHETQKKK